MNHMEKKIANGKTYIYKNLINEEQNKKKKKQFLSTWIGG